MNTRCCLILALSAWMASIGASASAQTTPRRDVLVVRAGAGLEDEARAIASRLIERSAALGDDVTLAPAPASASDVRDRVAEATLRAEEEFAGLGLADAGAAIDLALAAADEDGVRTRSSIVALLLLTSMVRGALGDDARADEAARDALAIDPTLVIDPAQYPPTLSARVDALRSRAARCAVHVSVDPGDAELTIDGEPSAPPIELGCGVHWITATRAGYARSTRRIVLASSGAAESQDVALSLTIDPASALASAGPVGAPIAPIVGRGAAALGRDLVVLDLAGEPDGALHATLGARSIRVARSATPDDIAAALIAPIEGGLDSGVVIGVSIGVGVVAAAAIAIAIGLALSPSAPAGWTGVGEVSLP